MRLRSAIAAALWLATCATAHASPAAQATMEPFAEAIVEVTINDQDAPVTLLVRRDVDGTLLVRAADLAALRLRTPARGAMQVNGERYYRLGTEVGAVVIFDEATQAAHVTLPSRAFLPTRRQASAADAPRTQHTAPGAFVNYDVSAEKSQGVSQGGGFFELGLFGTQGVGTATMVARVEGGRRSLTRLDTTWTRDFPAQLATLRLGDSISTPGSWGRALRFGGVQYGTNFGTQPTLVTTPLLAAQGEALVPSTVDVFVNGRQVASESVPPGPFAIDDVPALNGAGQLQVVVTDVLGRQQVLSQPYYSGSTLLRPELAEYSVELGSLRENYGTDSFAYGDLIGAATYRRGLTDTFTAGARVEAQGNGTFALGADTAWQAGTLGIVTAHAAAGGDGNQSGFLGGLGLEHNGRYVSAYAQTQYATREFLQLGASALQRTPRQRTFAGLGFDFAHYGNVQLAYGLQSFYDSASVATLGLNYSLTLGRLGYLGLFATHATADDSQTTVLLTWTLPLGERRTLSSALQQSSQPASAGGGLEAYTSIQQDLPSDEGLGYRVSLSSGEDQDASLAYQGRAGTATVDYASRDGATGVRVGATGAVALTSAGAMTARRLDQSFAVVQVADYPGLTVYLDNQPVGRTDERGRVLVNPLRPYERNAISLDPTEVPMDGALSQAAIDVTPAYRSGAVVQFPVSRAYAATMRLLQQDGTPVPAGAVAQFGGRQFPVALDGLLYVEGLATATTTRLVLAWQGGHCSTVAQRPSGNDALPDLGTLRCE
ncbi:MAG TPA: fimbria/pilus outer membrane usher protein [Steroidobacteraceae bacterium]